MKAVVSSPICPLYPRPDACLPLADEVLCGWPLELLDTPCPGWAQVRTHYRYEGFAPVRALTTGAGPALRWAVQTHMVVLPAAADVLSRPAVQSCITATLPRGSLVSVLGEADLNGWQYAGLPDGRTGYIRRIFLGPYYETPPSVRPEALRQRIITSARSYLGTQYRWGGKSPQGIDCSGLVFMACFLNGVLPYRDAQIIPGFPVREIPQAELSPADLLFFPGHVALYLGENMYLHSTAQSGGVVCSSLDPDSEQYRADLAGSITAVGSIFPL